MALSMFLRTPACTSRAFGQQIMRLATQPALAQRTVTSSLAASAISLKDANTTPILNSVRSFKTTSVRLSGETPHDHAKLWVIEKATSAILVPLIPLALVMPNKFLDSALAILITAHSFWGLEAMVVEYVRVILVGPLIPKLCMVVVYAVTAVMLGGLFYLIFNDVGLTSAFWKIWSNMGKGSAYLPGSGAARVAHPPSCEGGSKR